MRHFKKINYFRWQHLSLMLLLQLYGLCLMAQIHINGKVTDAEGKGVPGISVSVANTNFGTTTDINGVYDINANLREGNYNLEFTGVGYKAKTQSLQIGNAASYTSRCQLDIRCIKDG